jgi:hypothetical protein
MSARAWEVTGKGFVTEAGNLMRASCAHRSDMKACGGCYARLQVLLDEIERTPSDAARLIAEVTDAMKREVEAVRG